MNNLQSFSNFTEHCGCDHSEDKKKKSKVTKEEIIKEYGDPTVSKRLRIARAIDSTFRGKPKYNSKRAKLSNALKMSSIKAETRKRKAKENPYSAGKKLKAALGINSEGYIPEEGYDIARDMGMVKPSKDKKDATTANHTRETETDAQRKLRMLKQQKNTARAVENVKQRLRDKYGKNAIMDVGKKNEEVQLEKVNLRDKSTQYARSTKEVDTAMTDHVNRTKGRHYGKDGKVTEVGRYRKPSKREARNELIDLYKESYGRGRLTSTNDMQSKLYAKNNSMGKPRTDDEIRKEKGGQAFLDRIKAAKSKMKSEGTSYGLYKGTGKPSGPMAAFAKKTKKKKEVKEEMGNIAHTKTKKGGKTIINVNKNDEADAQKAMKNDPKYILGKTRVQSYKEEVEQIDELSKTTTANYLYKAKVDKNYVHSGKMGKYAKARDKGINRAEKKLGKKLSDRVNYVADTDTRSMKDDPNKSAYPRKIKVKEEFYQKRYTTGGYKPVGKNKRMDQSNKRSGDSKAQYRDLHKDLAKYGHVKTGKASNLKSGLKSFKESAWQRKEGKNPSGGLNEKGRKSYERENPGSDLKAPVTGKPKKGSKAEGRQNSFCARMSGVKGPMMKDGKPTRKKLALDKWDC
tara:strand:- start:985 stop:2868 length:1884 start_codon:yes stop_codon:yes gene_type:complete